MVSRFVFVATYIMASAPRGTLYVGSCNDLFRRAWEHREGVLRGFTEHHGCKMLVWYEQHDLMTEAIRRELAIKHWLRAWKVSLVEERNPHWEGLYLRLNG